MKTFFRIFNNGLYGVQVENIGFPTANPSYIPDAYLKNGEFVVMRTCHGIGDWCIISAIPRLLKEKYPNCKVYVPNSNMLRTIFGDMLNNWGYGTFDASTISKVIFDNNPYVDEFIDGFDGEIFHDHYKIFDPNNDKVSLTNQMMKFWQFKDDEMIDTTPDFYPTIKENNWFSEQDFGKYGYISLSSTAEETANTKPLLEVYEKYKDRVDNWMIYTEMPIKKSIFNIIENFTLVKDLNWDIRQQQLVKTKAIVNLGNETGMNLWTSKYSECFVLGNTHYGPGHGGDWKGKVRSRPFKTGNYVEQINYI